MLPRTGEWSDEFHRGLASLLEAEGQSFFLKPAGVRVAGPPTYPRLHQLNGLENYLVVIKYQLVGRFFATPRSTSGDDCATERGQLVFPFAFAILKGSRKNILNESAAIFR